MNEISRNFFEKLQDAFWLGAHPAPTELNRDAMLFLDDLDKITDGSDLTTAYRLLVKYGGKASGVVFSVFHHYKNEAAVFFERDYPALINTLDVENSFSLHYLRTRFGNFIGDWYRVPYSLENYPLENLLLHHAWEISKYKQDPGLVNWIQKHWSSPDETWQRPFSPFFDLQNPLQIAGKTAQAHFLSTDPGSTAALPGLTHRKTGEKWDAQLNFDYLFDNLGFSETGPELVRHALRHTLFICPSAWEIRASLASYCHTQPNFLKSFVVYLPAQGFSSEKPDATAVVLHAIAQQWIETLALNSYAFLELEEVQRQRLSRLLLWHAQSIPNLRAMLEDVFTLSSSKPGEEDRTYIFGEIVHSLEGAVVVHQTALDLEVFASMRPEITDHTILLVPGVSLIAGSNRDVSAQEFNSLFEIADRLQEKNVFFKTFVTQKMRDSLKADCEAFTVELSTTELAKACNARFAFVFSGQESASDTLGLNFIFLPGGSVSAEELLAEKARGSLGRMLQLGEQLLIEHARTRLNSKYLSIKEIEFLQG